LKSYINSLVANNITLGFTTGMSPHAIMSGNDKALADLSSFSSVASERGMRAARAKYPDVYEFIYDIGGHESMMRDAVKANGKVGTNQFVDMISGMSNSQLANDFTQTNFMEGTKAGDQLAALFDSTEIKQKLNFYRHQKKAGKSKQQAMEDLHEAFPSYAENLTDVMSLVDELVLFTKYFTNVPKITRFAFDKNANGMIGMFMGMVAAKEALYYALPEDPADGYMKDYGMTKVAPNTYVNVSSANNYNLSSMAEINLVNADTLMEHSTPLGADVSVMSFGANASGSSQSSSSSD